VEYALNISKATLREWRREFARHLRHQGIAANATERAVRGESRIYKTDGIYRAALRSASTHVRGRAQRVASELLSNGLTTETGKSKLVATRQDVERGWIAVADILAYQGHAELAAETKRLVDRMPPPHTEKEQIAVSLLRQNREPRRPHGPRTR